ncbi:glycosyltransferase family 2 protein [Pontibacter liquoris]|uniref:glycosyltransferase family 2 protein n=1 Tax=Pontibacter liquoris TaxID=2905677 RepID=UPI0021060122|nr:glycosyltransferase family 2 protein [Pontibacter liquoris]
MQPDHPILVSVIIPCYNCEALIGRAVDSVLAQTHPNIELLLVDNNSTDNTLQQLKEFEQAHPGMIRVYAEAKKGACAARNKGLGNAKGEWVQFLDADDELLPQKIEKQVALISKHSPDLIIDDYRKIRTIRGKLLTEDIVAEDDCWTGLINSRLGITSSNLWRKEMLLQVNGWNESLSSSQEYDLLFRVLRLNAKPLVSHQVQTLIHAQTNSISRTTNKGKLYELILNRYNLRSQIYTYLSENKLLTDKYKQQLYQYLYYHLLLISELDMPFFKEQLKKYNDQEITFRNKIKAINLYVRNSSKRKFAYANPFLKLPEWQFYFFKSLYLLRY